MEKLAYSCRGFNFHILLNSWSLMSLTFWPVAQFRNFSSEWFLDRKKNVLTNLKSEQMLLLVLPTPTDRKHLCQTS